MEYQKIIIFLDNKPNQPSKFKTKNVVEINDDSRRTYRTNSQIKYKNSAIKLKTILASNVLMTSGLTAAMLATDSAIQKKIYGSGKTALIISNEEMNDIIKIVKYLEEFDLLIKGFKETIQNEAEKPQRVGFLYMVLGTLVASLAG